MWYLQSKTSEPEFTSDQQFFGVQVWIHLLVQIHVVLQGLEMFEEVFEFESGLIQRESFFDVCGAVDYPGSAEQILHAH